MATNDDGDGKKCEQTRPPKKWKEKERRNETKRKSIYWYYTKIQFKNLQPFHLSIQSTTSMVGSLSLFLIAMENYCVRHAQQSDKVERMKINELNGREWKKREKNRSHL